MPTHAWALQQTRKSTQSDLAWDETEQERKTHDTRGGGAPLFHTHTHTRLPPAKCEKRIAPNLQNRGLCMRISRFLRRELSACKKSAGELKCRRRGINGRSAQRKQRIYCAIALGVLLGARTSKVTKFNGPN